MSEVQKALEELATPPAPEPDDKSPLEAQKTAADLDREEQRARTVYVLLLLHRDVELDDVVTATSGTLSVWEEIAQIEAASREAAWEEAKRRCPIVVPDEGEERHCQLIPLRFFRKITARQKPVVPQPPQLEVEGL